MLAALPMYDLPELRGATDALWAAIAAALRRAGEPDVPARLTRELPLDELWGHEALLLGQACGYPLTHALAGRVRLVATPCYDAPGCEGAAYRSLVIVAAGSPARSLEALRGATCALNDGASHSGMNALRALVAPLAHAGRFFGSVRGSGSHTDSLALVAAGEADVAAIDCVTHALLARHRPAALAGVRVLCASAPAPGLPLVTAAGSGDARVARLRVALREALAAPDLAAARATLLLSGVEALPLAAYDRVLALEAEARAHGYPELR